MKFQHTQPSLTLKPSAGSNINMVMLEGIKALLEFDLPVTVEFNGISYRISKEMLFLAIEKGQ